MNMTLNSASPSRLMVASTIRYERHPWERFLVPELRCHTGAEPFRRVQNTAQFKMESIWRFRRRAVIKNKLFYFARLSRNQAGEWLHNHVTTPNGHGPQFVYCISGNCDLSVYNSLIGGDGKIYNPNSYVQNLADPSCLAATSAPHADGSCRAPFPNKHDSRDGALSGGSQNPETLSPAVNRRPEE